MHHRLAAVAAGLLAAPALAAPAGGSCEALPAEALLAVIALLFALRPLGRR